MIYKVFTEDSTISNVIDSSTYSDLCIIEMSNTILELSDINYQYGSDSSILTESGIVEKGKQIIAKAIELIKKFFGKIKDFFTKGKIKAALDKLKEAKKKTKTSESDKESVTINIHTYPVDPFKVNFNPKFEEDLNKISHSIGSAITGIANGTGSDTAAYDHKYYDELKEIIDSMSSNIKDGLVEDRTISKGELEKVSEDKLKSLCYAVPNRISKIQSDMEGIEKTYNGLISNKSKIEGADIFALAVVNYIRDALKLIQTPLVACSNIVSVTLNDISRAWELFLA